MAVEFEAVWRDVRDRVGTQRVISTLSQGVDDDVMSVTDQAIVVRSHRTSRERTIPRRDFERAWTVVLERGEFCPSKHKGLAGLVGRSSIITAVLARSRYFDHDTRPIAVRLKQEYR